MNYYGELKLSILADWYQENNPLTIEMDGEAFDWFISELKKTAHERNGVSFQPRMPIERAFFRNAEVFNMDDPISKEAFLATSERKYESN